MQKEDKQKVVADLTDRLKSSETLIVADYRGLTMPQIDDLRSELLKHGAKFTVVKNTLTRRAAEAAGADALLALLEGPTAIAFLETDGDPVAVAKAIGATARETKVLAVRGGILDGRPITAEDIESLAKLPPLDAAPRPGARRDRRPALRDRRPVQRAAPEPRRADRRPDRAARRRRCCHSEPEAAESEPTMETSDQPAEEATASEETDSDGTRGGSGSFRRGRKGGVRWLAVSTPSSASSGR